MDTGDDKTLSARNMQPDQEFVLTASDCDTSGITHGKSAKDPSLPSTTPAVVVNVVTHPTAVLCKTVRIGEDGRLRKLPGARIPRGSSVSTRNCTLEEYVVGAFNGGVNQYALPANVMLGEKIELTTKDQVRPGAVDRTAQTMSYVEGPAIVTFDHDPNSIDEGIPDPDALWSVLQKHYPDVFNEGVARGTYFSSGSYIYTQDGRELVGAKGHHTVVAVEDATDLPRFNKALFQRLWLLGWGHIHITADGKMLERTLYDAKVLEPQQPVFAGGAHCLDGLEQRRPPVHIHQGGYLNTKAVPSLESAELEQYQNATEAARRRVKPEAERIRRNYQKREVERLVERGMGEARARSTVESRLGGTLVGDDVLHFAEHGPATVAEVLADPARFDGASLHDPVEPDYGSSSTAMFFANESNGEPVVHSHAHGGRNFILRHDEGSLIARFMAIPVGDLNEVWVRLLIGARLSRDAEDRVLKVIRQQAHISIQVLRDSLKDAKRELARKTNIPNDPGLTLAKWTLEEFYEGGDWLIRTEDGSIWAYTGTHWCRTSETVVTAKVQQVAEERWDAVVACYFAIGRQERPLLASAVSTAFSTLVNLVTVPGDPLRLASPRLPVINIQNGELWLESGGPVLKPHYPKSYLTSCSSITYDPIATAPTFEALVKGMLCEPGGIPFPDQDEMLRHIVELMGYVCQTERNLKVFILIVGPGDNGKTQLVKVIQKIVGLDAIAPNRLSGVDEEGNRFAVARLVGKLAVVDDDADHNYLLPDGFLKKIAEQKAMTGERKFKDEFAFIAQVVPIILTNSWPRSRDMSRGLRTRAQVLHLPRTFYKPTETSPGDPDIQRPDLWEKVHRDELPGVLNLLISGYYRLRARGEFLQPPSAMRAFALWWSEVNVLTRFVNEVGVNMPRDKPGVTTKVLSLIFDCWADENKVQQKFRPALNAMKEKMEELGYRVGHCNKGTAVYGLSVPAKWLQRTIDKCFCSVEDSKLLHDALAQAGVSADGIEDDEWHAFLG